MKMTKVSLAVSAILAVAAVSAVQASEVRRPYIVQLSAAPAASYTGGVQDLAATKPAEGEQLDVSASAVRSYVQYLENEQEKSAGISARRKDCPRI